MKDSFVLNGVYCMLLMSKRLETKKKPRFVARASREREKERRRRQEIRIDVFEKITITEKETLPYQNITMPQNRL